MLPTERVFRATGPAGGVGRLLPAATHYSLSGVEALCLTFWSLTTAVTLEVTGRTYRESDGAIIPFRETVPVTSNLATGTTTVYPLIAGALLNVRIGLVEEGVAPDLIFARLQLENGLGDAAIVIATLLQGFVSSSTDLAWPGSPIESPRSREGFITNAGWSVNNLTGVASQIVTSRMKWRLLGGRVDLTTNATVANRTVLSQLLTSGGSPVFSGVAPVEQPQSVLRAYSLMAGLGPTQINVAGAYHLPWPAGLTIPEAFEMRVVVGNFQAGDVLTGHALMVQEFMDI